MNGLALKAKPPAIYLRETERGKAQQSCGCRHNLTILEVWEPAGSSLRSA